MATLVLGSESAIPSCLMEPTTTLDNEQATELVDQAEDFVEEELLVEEISIDGMCGVY